MNPQLSNSGAWYVVENVNVVESPSLLVYPDRVDENLRRMLAVVGDAARLRPHVKTHKLEPIIQRSLAAGITKYKAATIAEAEITARAGAREVLLAYQPVGPNAARFLALVAAFPQTTFACLVDNLAAARHLSAQAVQRGLKASVLLDLDCGQHRTGVPADAQAAALYRELLQLPGLNPIGLHAYDGHLSTTDPAQREQECRDAFAPVYALRDQLRAAGLPVPTLVCGGTPTFPIHARRTDVECSPGTTVLWDFSYSTRLPDLDFLHAALVLTRVISKPGGRRLCLDLGHKAIAAENPHPRVQFLNEPTANALAHSEEHLVIEVANPDAWNVGDCLYGVPRHVCPTVALYSQATVIQNRRAQTQWPIAARNRHLSF